MPFVMQAMELKVDGISDVAHVCRKKGAFLLQMPETDQKAKINPYTCVPISELPYNINTMGN